jgi:sulfur-oxidizing protein SoxY
MAADLVTGRVNTARRQLLHMGLLSAAWIAGLIRPALALAAEWSKAAFESRKLDDALQNLFGSTQTTPSPSIKITAPYQAENGATVRLAASADLPNVSTIAVFVEKNERPLVMAMNFSGAQPYVTLRMKMAQSSDVHVVVKSQGKLYSAKQNIKVTVGGCGG